MSGNMLHMAVVTNEIQIVLYNIQRDVRVHNIDSHDVVTTRWSSFVFRIPAMQQGNTCGENSLADGAGLGLLFPCDI